MEAIEILPALFTLFSDGKHIWRCHRHLRSKFEQALSYYEETKSLEECISLVVDATVKRGSFQQIAAFRSGLNQVFDITSQQIFTSSELDYLMCGRRELWERLFLNIKFDNGYTVESPAIVNIMGELTAVQQKAFCQFVTGAPRLPLAGLAVLNPKLTFVHKVGFSVNGVLTLAFWKILKAFREFDFLEEQGTQIVISMGGG